MEGYTPPQAQGEGSAAIAEGVALRQVGYDAPLGSKLEQGFADVGDDGGGRGVLGQGGVQGDGVGSLGDHETLA